MNIITQALDTLALKLTDYKHRWNNQERKLYESAIKKAGQIEPQVSGQNGISREFTCKCGQQKGWISENTKTKPCPNCGRKYIGKYNQKKLTIDAVQVLSR